MVNIQEFHSYFPDSVKWRLTSGGIEISGSNGPIHTVGMPNTVKRIWTNYQQEITKYSTLYRIPIEIIIANIATESSGITSAYREEPGFVDEQKTPDKVSAGLMQTLLSTASSVLGKKLSSEDLKIPDVSIHAGTSYIAAQAFKTNLDPVLVPAAYNSGGLYYQNGEKNRFKLRQYPLGTSEHVDRWILWFNDCRYAINSGFMIVDKKSVLMEV